MDTLYQLLEWNPVQVGSTFQGGGGGGEFINQESTLSAFEGKSISSDFYRWDFSLSDRGRLFVPGSVQILRSRVVCIPAPDSTGPLMAFRDLRVAGGDLLEGCIQ